jgi:hypothetical protein
MEVAITGHIIIILMDISIVEVGEARLQTWQALNCYMVLILLNSKHSEKQCKSYILINSFYLSTT